MTGQPVLDSLVVLATAAATTERVAIGTGVLLVGLRPIAWVAKQIATLQVLSGGRGPSSVSAPADRGPTSGRPLGVPFTERGRRTDRALALLPPLLAGADVVLDELDGAPTVALAPVAPLPPVWVGGGSRVARRRALAHDGTWFPSMVLPADVGAGRADLRALAAELARPVPPIAVGLFGSLGPDGVPASHLAAGISGSYGVDADRAAAAARQRHPGRGRRTPRRLLRRRGRPPRRRAGRGELAPPGRPPRRGPFVAGLSPIGTAPRDRRHRRG